MGNRFRYYCSNCDYEVVISGGRDCGFDAFTETCLCEDCHELVDVFTGSRCRETPTDGSGKENDMNRCPQCESEQITAWPASNPCPKCGSEMKKGELVLLWD